MTTKAADLPLGHPYQGSGVTFKGEVTEADVCMFEHKSPMGMRVCHRIEAAHRPKAAGLPLGHLLIATPCWCGRADDDHEPETAHRPKAATCCVNADDDGNCDRHKPMPAAEARPPGCTCGESWPCKLHGGPPELPAADKALEEKAERLVTTKHAWLCVLPNGCVCSRAGEVVAALVVLRDVAEQARGEWKREAEWIGKEVAEFGHPLGSEGDHHEVRDWLNDMWEQARREEAAEWRGIFLSVARRIISSDGEPCYCDDYLGRRDAGFDHAVKCVAAREILRRREVRQ